MDEDSPPLILRRPRSMESLLPPNYDSDKGRFELGLPSIRPAWLLNESIKSLDSKFPMVPAPEGTIVLYTTPLGEKLWKNPLRKEFDLTDPLRPSLSYNYLHDEHLKYYFRSEDLQKRLKDEGFITDHGFVKCTLKEFNEYRQWIRKLKLHELYRERRLETEEVEETKKQRLESLALERDVELQEIMKRRREKRKKDNETRKKMIEKEQRRQQKLAQIDNKRREHFNNSKTKEKDRVRARREMERMRRRKLKDEQDKQELTQKIRIATKLHVDNDERLKRLQEKKKEAEQEKIKTMESQWYRRQSWSHEFHEQQKRSREMHEEDFHEHVVERNVKVSKQRRHSQVCFEEIANANRVAFETKLQNADVFMAKLNEKRTRELEKWKKHFEEMKQSSVTSMRRPSVIASRHKTRGHRRRSTWDLEACLLKDLGMDESEIAEHAYSKLGVITHSEPFLEDRDIVGEKRTLGTLEEVEEHVEEVEEHLEAIEELVEEVEEHVEETEQEGQEPGNESDDQSLSDRNFSIPMIVESLASLHSQSTSSQSETNDDTDNRSTEEHAIKATSSTTRASNHNIGMSRDQLQHVISKYVENIMHHSADVLGVKVKMPDRNKGRPANLVGTDGSGMISAGSGGTPSQDQEELHRQVQEFVQGIVKRASEIAGVNVKFPDRNTAVLRDETPVENSQICDPSPPLAPTKPTSGTKRQVKELLSGILDKAEQSAGVLIKRPQEYEHIKIELAKKHKSCNAVEISTPNQVEACSQDYTNPRHVARRVVVNVVQAVGKRLNVKIKLPPEYQSFVKPDENEAIANTSSPINPIKFGREILEFEVQLDSERAEKLRHENLIMMASQVVLRALMEGLLAVRARRRNSQFFMGDASQTTSAASQRRRKEKTAHLKTKRCKEMKRNQENCDQNSNAPPRESDHMEKFQKLCGFDFVQKMSDYLSSELDGVTNSRGKTGHMGPGNKAADDKKKTGAGESAAKKTGDKSRGDAKRSAKKPGKSVDSDVIEGVSHKTEKSISAIGAKAGVSQKTVTKSQEHGQSKAAMTSVGPGKESRITPPGKSPVTKEKEFGQADKKIGESGFAKGIEDRKSRSARKEPGEKMSRTGKQGPGAKESKGSEPGDEVLKSEEPQARVQSTDVPTQDALKEPGDETLRNPTSKSGDALLTDAMKKSGDDASRDAVKRDFGKVSHENESSAQKYGNKATGKNGGKVATGRNGGKEGGQHESKDSGKVGDKGMSKNTTQETGDKKKGEKPRKRSLEKVSKGSGAKWFEDDVRKTTEHARNVASAEVKTDGKKPKAQVKSKGSMRDIDHEKETQSQDKKDESRTPKTSGDYMGSNERDNKSPLLPHISPTPESSAAPSVRRSGAITPSTINTERRSSQERLSAGSSSAMLRTIRMRECQEQSDISPQSSYVVLPHLSTSESVLISGKMESLHQDAVGGSRRLNSAGKATHSVGQNSQATHSQSQNSQGQNPRSYIAQDQTTWSQISQDQTSDRNIDPSIASDASTTHDQQAELVKLPRMSSPEIPQLPPRSPTPTRCTSRSSVLSLPHIDSSSHSLVGSNEAIQTTTTSKADKTKASDTKQDSSTSQQQQPTKSSSLEKIKPQARDNTEPDSSKKATNESSQARIDVTKQPYKEESSVKSKTHDSTSHPAPGLHKKRASVDSHQDLPWIKTRSSATDSITSIKRTSLSKSLSSAAVPGGKSTYGAESRTAKHPEKSSRTEIRRASITGVGRHASKTSSTYIAEKTRHSMVSVKTESSEQTQIKATETRTKKDSRNLEESGKDSETQENKKQQPLTNTENKFLPAKTATPGTDNQEISTTENVTQELRSQELRSQELRSQELRSQELRSQELRSQELRTQELRTQELSTQELNTQELNTQATGTVKSDVTPNVSDVSPSASDIGSGGGDVNTNASHSKPSPKPHSNEKNLPQRKISKTQKNSTTKLKQRSKTNNGSSEKGHVSTTKTSSSRTLASKSSSNSEKHNGDASSRSSETILKRSSGSRPTIQDSKHGVRRRSVIDSRKSSERSMRRRSSTISENVRSTRSKTSKSNISKKSHDKVEKKARRTSVTHAQSNEMTSRDVSETSHVAEDDVHTDIPDKAESDPEVVVKVYVADQPDGSNLVVAIDGQPGESDVATVEESKLSSVETENKVVDGVETGNEITDVVETGKKIVDDVETGHKVADDAETGNKIVDGVESGHKVTDDAETGHKVTDDVEPGHKVTDDVEPGHKVTDDVETGNKVVDGVTEKKAAGEDHGRDTEAAKDTGGQNNTDDLQVVGSGAPKITRTREDLKKTRKSRSESTVDKHLMNLIPRNSLDILKVTKISAKEKRASSERHLPKPPSSTKPTGSRSTIGSKTPNSSRSYRKTTPSAMMEQGQHTSLQRDDPGIVTKPTPRSLMAEGVGLSVKSASILKSPHPSMQRLSSKMSCSLEKVDETPTETPGDVTILPQRSGDDKPSEILAVTKVSSKPSPPNEKSLESPSKEVPGNESLENAAKPSVTKNVNINSASFSDIIQGTPLLNKDTSPKTSPQTSGFLPSPPSGSKPDIVSPKLSRVRRSISNGSSGRSRASIASNAEMSPTASLEIVKLSSHGSHGWVSSPTSSVKFLPPIEARASKSSHGSAESHHSKDQRPRTADSGSSRAGSNGSRGIAVEIRRSNSGNLRVDGKGSDLIGKGSDLVGKSSDNGKSSDLVGKGSDLIAVRSSSSGSSSKQAVIGF